MACRAIHSWTFCSIIGAFLDLAIAYFMLCGAMFAFVTAKFLGIFGLNLPCACGGLFGRPLGRCLQHLLVEYPPRLVSSVQVSARSRFPFDSVWAVEQATPGCFNVKLVRNEAQGNRLLELPREEEEACGSVSNLDVGKSQNYSSDAPSSVNKGDRAKTVSSSRSSPGSSDVKGKGVIGNLKPRMGLRRRRRAGAGQRRAPSILPTDLQLACQGAEGSFHSTSEQSQGISGDNLATLNSGESHNQSDSMKSSGTISVTEGEFFVTGQAQDLAICQAACASEEHEFERSRNNTVRTLEQALREERAARSALRVELEKERSAAATAADEAMAMILRLQKEKASIEMEARQYRRMVEEKTAYDEEEMDILKEIIVRREREKHFLEKEVELYRNMIDSGEHNEHQQLDDLSDMNKMIAQKSEQSLGLDDDPNIMCPVLSEPIAESENSGFGIRHNRAPTDRASSDDIALPGHPSHKKEECGTHSVRNTSILGGFNNQYQPCDFHEEVHSKLDHHGYFSNIDAHNANEPMRSDECHMNFNENGILTIDVHTSPHQRHTSELGDGACFHKLNKSSENIFQNCACTSIDKSGNTEDDFLGQFPSVDVEWENNQDAGERDCKSCLSHFKSEQNVHDVHVIDDKSYKTLKSENVDSQRGTTPISFMGNDFKLEFGGKNIDILGGNFNNSWSESEQSFHRSCSDCTGILLPVNTSHDSSFFPVLRRNSMSAVGKERSKLETEVECLRGRLKIVQQGREKLSFNLGSREKENLQLQLLEEIASRLHNIRQLSEPGNATCQVSLPQSSSQVSSRRRRSRSVPFGTQKNT